MKIPKGPTVQDLWNRMCHLRPEDKASPREREKARESLLKRCPYLVGPKKKKF
jgi:hypothetical protein